MNKKLILYNRTFTKVEDFLNDDDFLKYVLGDAPYLQTYWERLLLKHSEYCKYFNEAQQILLIDKIDSNYQKDIEVIKERIIKSLFIN